MLRDLKVKPAADVDTTAKEPTGAPSHELVPSYFMKER